MNAPRPASTWHARRARRAYAEHPELRALAGPDPTTAVVVLALVALQIVLGVAVAAVPWWAALVVAYLVGSVVAHALGVAIHELAHDLVFRAPWKNRALAIVANLPLLAPAAIDFRDKHLRHHRKLGPWAEDPQAPTPLQVRLAEGSTFRRAVWLTFGGALFHATPSRDRRTARDHAWLAANVAACVVAVALAWTWSPVTCLYLGASALLAFGPHPVGIRRYAEHVVTRPGQPTSSYYGAWNHVALNVGHHVEHHDFPRIPWRRLPAVRRIAPELYEHLATVPSWSRLLLRFLRSRAQSVGSYAAARVAPSTRRVRERARRLGWV